MLLTPSAGGAVRGVTRLAGAAFLALLAVLLGSGFVSGAFLPLRWLIVGFWIVAFIGFVGMRTGAWTFLPRFALLIYALPFSTMLGYLVDPEFTWWLTPESVALMREPRILQTLMTVGFTGLIGLIVGVIAGSVMLPAAKPTPPAARTLSMPVYAVLVLAAVALSAISAPDATVFEKTYAESGGSALASRMNFNSAFLISYALLILGYVDAELARESRERLEKRVILGAAVLFIVVYLQILRGDRESIGLLAALFALYLTARPPRGARVQEWTVMQRRRLRRVALPAVGTFLVYAATGMVRNAVALTVVTRSSLSTLLSVGALGTAWTAVLLTNLAIAAQHFTGRMDYLFGKTYADYILSLPPGIVTRSLGIERPLESTRGPAWWGEGISAGGIHVVLVPFKNFGIFGVPIVLALFGFLFVRLERWNDTSAPEARLTYGITIASLLFWFWYGDMYILRGLMLAAALALPYAHLVQAPRATRVTGWQEA